MHGAAAKAGYRRPDILLYINGLPLVFIELKNSNVKLRTAYDDNLTNYKADIPQLFLANALCVFSNGIETRVGSLTAEWEHFFHWLRPDDEKEKIKREQIARTAPALSDSWPAFARRISYSIMWRISFSITREPRRSSPRTISLSA